MKESKLRPLPTVDPFDGSDLYVSELRSMEGDTAIQGRFAIPKLAKLSPEHAAFLETFLRCRGQIAGVERELGISYPTVRAKLDALIEAMGLSPVKEEKPKKDKSIDIKRQVLDQLERGEITAEEAKKALRGEQNP